MVKLDITQQPGVMGLEKKPLALKIESPPAGFRLQQTSAGVEISKDWPAIKIDQTEMRASMGYKGFVRLEKDNARRAREIASAGIVAKSKEGDTLGRIEKKGNPIPAMAASSAWPGERETNIGLMPSVPPKISFTGGMKTKFVPGDLQVDIQPNLPQIQVQQGFIRTYLEARPSIEIKATGVKVDLLG